MKLIRLVLAGAVLLGVLDLSARGQTYIWSGVGTGWQGQLTIPNNGTADLVLIRAINPTLTLNGNLSINSIVLQSDDDYAIVPSISASLPVTLTLGSGVVISSSNIGTLHFDPNVNLALTGSPVFDAGGGAVYVPGQITGSLTTLNLTSSATGGFVFNNIDYGNAYTGSTLIAAENASAQPFVAFWNSSPFGTGAVTISDAAILVAHGNVSLANPITFTSAFDPNNTTNFRTWDAPLAVSGALTLATNTVLQASTGQAGVASPDNSGVYPIPGAPARYPVEITGNIGESGSRSLTVGGAGVLILDPASGANTYSGGTIVNGSLVAANSNALPGGTGNVTVNAGGYAGYADTSASAFATFLAHINVTSGGAVGIDTLPGASSTAILTDPINLSGFTNTGIRIGTATSAIIQSAFITPQGANYQFGNGGGNLYVQTNLPNVSTVSSLLLTDQNNSGLVWPLKLYLQGNNTYTGGTTANNGFIIFDGTNAIPSSGQLTAAGSSTTNGASYVGYTDAVASMTPATFLAKFNTANTWGIIGFDTHAGNSTVNIGSVNLTGFNNGVFLGTATSANLTGPLTPTADNTLRLTAGNGGTLTVSSAIGGATALVVGSPSPDWHYADGTVVLNPATANTYTGGTTINSYGPVTLEVGGTTPLGTGALTIGAGNLVPVGLTALTPSYNVANNVVFQTPGTGLSPGQLYLTGANPLTLSGNLSGPALSSVNLINSTATLSGNNSAYAGDLGVLYSTLNLANNNAAGTGTLYFYDNGSTVNFTGAATAPVLYGIEGKGGTLVVPNGTALTFDISNGNNYFEFAGEIDNGDGVASTASLTVTATPSVTQNVLYLYGASNYSGGTTITNAGILALGNNHAAGTGMVTVNASTGGLLLNTGITLTNPLTFTSGALGGFGTFAPSNLTNVTFGTNQLVLPGSAGTTRVPAGALTFNTDVTFANGGTYVWSLQDSTRSDGFSQLLVNGNFNITASGGGFLLQLGTYDSTGKSGIATFDGSPTSWAIVQSTGTITGFSPSAFTIDASAFDGGIYPANDFSLSLDGTGKELLLNFAQVPEPSTWALLGGGLLSLGVAGRRRRRG